MLHPTVKMICCLVLLWATATQCLAQQAGIENNSSVLMVEADFDVSLLPEIEVTLVCTSGTPGRITTRIKPNENFKWIVGELADQGAYCQAYAEAPRGFSIKYAASGESTSKADENGCQYAEVVSSQINFCRIEVTQDHVPLTVYKKWVGATEDEADVAVNLLCDNGLSESPRYINHGLSATWQISNIPPQGLVCTVSESPGETFISDEEDCQDLLLIPGRGEACTMVNTKVVKRIEMLNRYGKIIMILVMLSAGLIAVRKYV